MTISKLVLTLTLCALFRSAFASAQNNPLPDFTLPSVTDTSHFTLSRERGSYIALHFLLKTECPYCIRHTREYVKKAPTLFGVQQIFIKPDTEEEIRAWAVKLSPDDPFPFPVYQDKDAALAERLGIPGGYRFHGQVVHYPALILLDPKGREVFRYVGTSNADRLPFEKFAEKVRELQREHSEALDRIKSYENVRTGPLPDSIERRMDSLIIAKTGERFFQRYFELDTAASGVRAGNSVYRLLNEGDWYRINRHFTVAYSFRFPDAPWRRIEFSWPLDSAGSVVNSNVLGWIPVCRSDSSVCTFTIDSVASIEMARRAGLPAGLTTFATFVVPMTNGSIQRPKQFAWSVTSVLANSERPYYYKAAIYYVDPYSGMVIDRVERSIVE